MDKTGFKSVIVRACIVLAALFATCGTMLFFAKNSSKKVSKITNPEMMMELSYNQLDENSAKIDNCDYVQFSAYFLRDLDNDGYAEKLDGSCNSIGTTDTLYVELDILAQGYLENGKITLTDNNYTWTTAVVEDSVIKGNYVGKTSEITLQDHVLNGTQKIIWGEIASNVGGNINNYSKVSSITLTGTHVIEGENGERTETEINKTFNVKVDWYGTTRTTVSASSISKDIDTLTNGDNVVVNFDFTVNETKKELILEKQVAEVDIPKLNGYSPISVNVSTYGVESEYNDETGLLTITKSARLNQETGAVSQISRQNTYKVQVVYPMEAYTENREDSVYLDINIKGYNYGYNNNSKIDEVNVFENPHVSSDSKSIRIVYAEEPVTGYIWNLNTYVGDYVYNEEGRTSRYEVSKKYPLNIYNGNIYEDNTDLYTVKWRVDIGEPQSIDKITVEEPVNGSNKKSDELVDSDANKSSMYNFSTTKGIYFTGTSSVLGSNGWIKLYNAETGALIETFTSENWFNYTAASPYEVNLKSIKIETSKPLTKSSLYVYQIKEIDDDILTSTYTQEQFNEFKNIYTYVKGTINAPEGITYDSGSNEATLEKSALAYYDAPYSRQSLGFSQTKISNQETTNINIGITTSVSSMIESEWQNGTFLIEMPEEIIKLNVNSVESSNEDIAIKNYYAYQENGKYFIKIHTQNDEPSVFRLTINADVTANPVLNTRTVDAKLYAYNENCDNYSSKIQDTYEVDGDSLTTDMVGYSTASITLSNIGSAGLITTEFVTDYDEDESITIAPNVAEIEKSDNSKTATVNVSITNNYTGTLSEIVILGKTPYEGNTYAITGADLGSTYTANITGPITVPSAIQSYVTVYYSENEETNKDLADASNGWTLASNISDWSKVKTYLIDLGDYVLSQNENKTFTYEVNVPGGLGYNSATFSHHAVYYYLDTENGKLAIQTEPNKVGIQVVGKYDLQITKTKVGDNSTLVSNATYKAETTDVDGNIITTVATTDNNGVLTLKDLYVDRAYTLIEVSVPEPYEISDKEIKFTATVNSSGNLIFNINSTETFVGTPEVTTKANGDYLVKAKLEDEIKYTLRINKDDENGNPVSNVRFTFKAGGKTRAYRTDSNGEIVVTGLHLGDIYELKEISADGYYVNSETQIFKVIRNSLGNLELQTENINSVFDRNILNDTLVANIINVKIPTYNLQILKVEEDYEEEDINNLTPLANASFLVEGYDDGTQEEYKTNANGIIEINDLYAHVEGEYITGKYIIKEVIAPTGYSNNSEEINLVVTQTVNTESGTPVAELSASVTNEAELTTFKKVIVEGNTVKLVVEDKPLFQLKKVDAETGEVLANAEFAIYQVDKNENEIDFARDINGEYIGTLNNDGLYTVTTDENGIIVLPLKGGLYKAVEVTYPEGYLKLGTEQYFKVADGTENDTEEEDEPGETPIDESQYTVIQIQYIEDLADLATAVNAGNDYSGHIVKLMNDLDYTDPASYRSGEVNPAYISGGSGTPKIGSNTYGTANKFGGIFDGQGHTIKNTYNNPVFGGLSNGTLKNLTVTGQIENGGYYTGGIVGYAFSSNITNCTNYVDVKGSSGIVAYSSGSTIKNCTNYGNIVGKGDNNGKDAAGIVTFASSGTTYIDKCTNYGKIKASGIDCYAAGIACEGKTVITNCINYGDIVTDCGGYEYDFTYAGGIAGQCEGSISDCINEGTLLCYSDGYHDPPEVGGIVGTAKCDVTNCINKANISMINEAAGSNYVGGIAGNAYQYTISNCANTGNITGGGNSSNYIGGIAGKISKTTIINSYNTGNIDTTTSRSSCATSIGGIVGNDSSSAAVIKNVYNTGNITGTGGNKGYAGGISGSLNNSTIENGYNSADISMTSTDSYAGGVIGYLSDSSKRYTASDIYYVEYIGLNANTVNTTGETTEEFLKSDECYELLNEDDVWSKRVNNYPVLKKNNMGILSDVTKITVDNTIKKFKITTEVEDGVGGSISGEGMDPYESVRYAEDSVLPIIMTPDNGYVITKITINGIPVDFILEDGQVTYQLDQFTNMLEDKHIVVKYTPEDQILKINKVDEENQTLKLEGAKFKIEEIESRSVTDEVGTLKNSNEEYNIPNIGSEVENVVGSIQQTTLSDYYFEPSGDKYVSNNHGVKYSDAVSYFEIDLTGLTGQYYVSMDWLLSSESSDYGWSSITDTDDRSLTYLKNTLWMRKYGRTGETEFRTIYYNQPLEGGNKYYLYVGYYKDYNNDSGNDEFTVGNVKVYNVTFDTRTFGFDLVDGKYVSNNQGYDNTVAHAYIPIDLRNTFGDYDVTVNIDSSCGSGDYGCIGINETPDDTSSNMAYISSNFTSKQYKKKITAGKMYYLHFSYRKDISEATGEDCLKINSVKLEVNTSKEYLNVESTTNSAGEINLEVSPGRYKITEIEAPSGYRLDKTEHIVDVPIGAGKSVTITNKKQPKIIVHHYLVGTTNKVAEDEIYKDDVGKEYTTHPHTDLVDLELQKDVNNQYVIPDNASGVYIDGEIEVIYYYEAEPIELVIHHYLEGTVEQLAEDEFVYTDAVVSFEGDSYTVTAEDSYDLDTNANYNSLLDDYELVFVTSTISDEVGIDDTLTYNEDSEITYFYTLKKHTITTEVEPHEEMIKDILTGETETFQVEGGSITGEYNVDYPETNKIKFVENVEQKQDSTIQIVATPDSGYKVNTIKLVSTNDDGIETETVIYGENASSSAEISFTENEDRSVMLSTFKDVTENKHIIVTFSHRLDCVYTVNYLDRYTEEKIHTSKVQGNMEYGSTVLSANEIIDIENYEYYSVDKEFITIDVNEENNVINIYYTPFGAIEVAKKDSITNEYVPNAKFGIYSDINCNDLVEEVETEANGKVTARHLELGTYYVKEIEAPEFYELNNVIKTAVVRDATNIVTVEIEDTPLGYVQIEKLNSDGSKHLEGAVYGLYSDANCQNLVERLVTGQNGFAKSNLVPVATYYLKEIQAPANYVINTNSEIATITSAGNTATVTVRDSNYSAQITVVKKDLSTNQTVLKSGTKFLLNKITTSNNKIDGTIVSRSAVTVISGNTVYGTIDNPFETDSTGTCTIMAQDAGLYEIVEVGAPNGYILSGYEAYTEDGELVSGYVQGGNSHAVQTPVRFEITGDGTQTLAGAITVEQYDAPQTGTLKLYKSGEALESATTNNNGISIATYENKPIERASFSVYADEDIYTADNQGTKIYSKDEKIADITTGSDGYAYLDNIPYGKYYVKETVAGSGYVLNSEVKRFEISASTLNAQELVENEAQKTAVNIEDVNYVNERQEVEISVTKVDSVDTTKKLEGVLFGLYAKEDIKDIAGNVVIAKDTLVGKATTENNGVATFTEDLPLGKYYVKELETIYGYVKIESEFEIDASYAGQDVQKITKSITVQNELKDTDVIVHYYIYGTTTRVPDINGDEIEDIIIPGKVGDSYTTSSSDEVPEYYEFVESTNNTSGEMTEGRIEVIYYYRLKNYSGLVKYLEKDSDTDDSNNVVLHNPKNLENQIYGTNIVASNEVIDITGYVYDSCDKNVMTIGTNPSENILTLYYVKGTFEYEVHYFYDGIEDPNEEEHGTATYKDIITYDDVIDNFGDKIKPGYDLTDYNPVDSTGELALEISVNPEDNVINIYYRTKYTVETAVKPHEETTKNGTTSTVYGGKIYESAGTEHSIETVYKYDDSTKNIIITPDSGYEIVSIKVKDGKDATEETSINVSDVVSSNGTATLNASNGYFTNMQSNKYVEVEFRKKSKVIVKYLSATETDDSGNPLVLAEEVTINGYETKDFETQRKPVTYYQASSKGVTDENDSAITIYDRVSLNGSGNATGTMYADTLTVIYWYERVPSGILVKHIEITEKDKAEGLTLESGSILDSEVIPGYVSLVETTYRNTYTNYISVNGPTSSDEDIIIALSTENEKVAEYKELEDGDDYVVEVRYYYEKQYKVTTEVKPHDENGTQVSGGHITGEGQEYEEIINKLGYNSNAIVCSPDYGYRVKSITVNDESIDLATLNEDSNHNITLPARFFTEVDENKHVVVEYERIPAKVITKYKDIDTDEEIETEETQEGFVKDPYETESKDIEDYILIDDEPEGHEGEMTEEDILVIYYYKKQFKITTDVVEHEEARHTLIELPKEGAQDIEIVTVKGGTISGEDETPYETVFRGATSENEITMKADKYYRIVSVTVNGEEVEIVDEKGFTLDQFEDVQQDIHVVVKYERIPAVITVKYLEVDTDKVLADEEFSAGNMGENYSTVAKNIEGYELVKVIGNSDGTLESDETIVTYYYKKVEPKKNPINGAIDGIINRLSPKTGDHIVMYTVVLVISTLGLVILVKRRK